MTEQFDYKQYLGGKLSKKALRQFDKALIKPKMEFENKLTPHLMDDDRFYSLSEHKKRPGRNHHRTKKVCNAKIAFSDNAFFANALKIAEAQFDANGKTYYRAPMDRVRLGPVQVYTFEFDYADLEFFERQLGWLRSRDRHDTDSLMGDFYKACAQWADFRGITVCWSGHKSLHIHVVFDVSDYVAKFEEPASPRDGLVAHWLILEKLLFAALGLSGTPYASDQQLRFPEQYRRLPGGSRIIENDHHFLGIPKGTIVPQITLWEHWMGRAPKGVTALFHRPNLFAQKAPEGSKRGRKMPASRDADDFTPDEIAYCEAQLRDLYPPGHWPCFSHLSNSSGSWTAHFRNSAHDSNPASVIRAGYRAVYFQGRDSNDLMASPLNVSLGEMMDRWVAWMHAPADEIVEIDGPEHEIHNQFERAFAEAMDRDEALAVLDRRLPWAVSTNRLLLVNGPEGAGKTSTLLRHHAAIARTLEAENQDRANPRRALYTFMSYQAAAEKCAAFNAMQAMDSRFVGVVLPSFSQAYKDACTALRVAPISRAEAARNEYPSLWSAIEAGQPQVIEEFRRQHEALWTAIGAREPVFFTVQQVAHGWSWSSHSRLMWAPSWWSAPQDARYEICREETRLSLLVHDEVKRETFAAAISCSTYQWLDGLRRSAPGVWKDGMLNQREAYFTQYSANHPPPSSLDFEKVGELLDLDFEEAVVTANSGEYGPCDGKKDIYKPCHGTDWRIARRNWWSKSGAQRTVFLTTEIVPTIVAQRADGEIKVVHLDAAKLPRDAIDVHPCQGVRSHALQSTVTQWTAKQDEPWFPISNKLNGAANTMSHALARGSNALIGQNVVQTMTFLAPGEYEELQALNTWCGRDDLVLLRHIDEFNQTAGRNMGFRHRNGVKHALLIGHGLLDRLMNSLGYSRYDWTIHLSAEQRKTIHRKGTEASQVASDDEDDDNVIALPVAQRDVAACSEAGEMVPVAEVIEFRQTG